MSSDWTTISPLKGYENAERLPYDFKPDDPKALYNPPTGIRSPLYDAFPAPIKASPGPGFDFHVYYIHTDPEQLEYARQLHERVRREFPELRVLKFHETAVGPHPVAQFEVNVFTPVELGAVLAFMVAYRGPCSVLVHPNTDGDLVGDHTDLATWLGPPFPLNTHMLKKYGAGLKAALENKTFAWNGNAAAPAQASN